MSSKYFGSQRPYRDHLARSNGLGREVADLRRDVEVGFSAVQAKVEGPDPLSTVVYVAQAGDDEAGDGTLVAPYATLAGAFRALWGGNIYTKGVATGVQIQIRVVAPYQGPIGKIEVNFRSSFQLPDAGAGVGLVSIHIQSWTDTDLGEVTDPRFTVLAGPLTPVSVTTFAGNRARYTMAPGTILADEQWGGEFVRIYQAGVEISRGIVVRSTLATEELLLHPSPDYTPAATDQLYVVQPTVVLGGIPPAFTPTGSTLHIGGVDSPYCIFENIRTIDVVFASGEAFWLMTGCQLMSVGGAGSWWTSNYNPDAKVALTNINAPSLFAKLDSLTGGSVLFRGGAGTGFVTTGVIDVGPGSVMWGAYFAGNDPTPGVLTVRAGATLRGRPSFEATGRPNGKFVVNSGTVANPVLMIPPPTGGGVLMLGETGSANLSGVIAVDAVSAAADFIQLDNGSNLVAAAATVVPADATVPALAAGAVVKMLGPGFARVSTTNTLAGAGGVDIQVGGNAGLTWAALDAAPGKRDTDAAVLATAVIE